MLQDETGFWFDIRIVAREVISEKFAILEDFINSFAEKSGFTTEPPNGFPIRTLVWPDYSAER
jgi:hypothetical protein